MALRICKILKALHHYKTTIDVMQGMHLLAIHSLVCVKSIIVPTSFKELLLGMPLCHILGIHMCIMCLTQSTWKVKSDKMVKLKHCRNDTILSSAYPSHGSASQVNCLGADMQVVSCHYCHLSSFCWAVNCLPLNLTSGLVLASSSILRLLDLDLHRMPKWYVKYA